MEASEFCKKVEDLAASGSTDGYIDAVLCVCEENRMEPFVGAKLLSKPITEKIKKEGKDINLLPTSAKLPFE